MTASSFEFLDLKDIKDTQLLAMVKNARLPELSNYLARDGRPLHYRHYPAQSQRYLVLIHGVSEDSKYLHYLAEFISSRSLANVLVLDLRGYGAHPDHRGDIRYIGQIEDDIADLLSWIRQQNSDAVIILGGHSLGGGTSIRFAASKYANLVDAYLLLAPYIHPLAPTSRKNFSARSSHIKWGKIILLSTLRAFGIRRLEQWFVFTNNRPPELRHGTETLHLTYV